MGTPHLRWRLMHQSLRPCVMDVMRRWPASGIHRTISIAVSAASLDNAAGIHMKCYVQQAVARRYSGKRNLRAAVQYRCTSSERCNSNVTSSCGHANMSVPSQ